MKRNLFLRGAALLLSLLMLVSLAACAAKTAEEDNSTAVTEESSAADGESQAESKADTEDTESASESADPENTNVLTGLPTLTDEAIGKRPVAVMINNVKPALPQYGVSAADIMFEVPVEGNQTRMMAVYGDYTQIPDVCSVRSCRYYYPILALSYDAVYVNWGMDQTIATDVVAGLDLDQFDGANGGALFGRDTNRQSAGYALEHTGMFHGGKLPETMESKGTRTDLKENWEGYAFNFAAQGETVVPAEADGEFMKVNFGAQSSSFNYNAETHRYEKLHGSDPHMDAVSGEQLAFENVIILETDISTRDEKGRKNVNWQGGEDYTGYYFTEGAMQKITWSKEDEYSKLKFFDADGNELVMNRGKTYIGITTPGTVSMEE